MIAMMPLIACAAFQPKEPVVNILNEAQVKDLLAGAINESIDVMQEQMLEMPQVEMPVDTMFVNGMNTRTLLIPEDTLLVGAVHLEDYVDIMIYGDITVATPDGLKRLSGFNIMQGKKGRKRAGYAHKDTLWVTVHKTDIDNAEDFVKLMTRPTMKEYLMLGGPSCQ